MTACPTCGHVTPTVLRSWETWIDAKVESANARNVNIRIRSRTYSKARDAWMWRWRSATWASAMLGDVGLNKVSTVSILASANQRRHVTFTRHYSGRQQEFDHANLVGGAKGMVDAMVRVGLLVDDSPKWFEAEYRQIRSDRSGLHVRIEERE